MEVLWQMLGGIASEESAWKNQPRNELFHISRALIKIFFIKMRFLPFFLLKHVVFYKIAAVWCVLIKKTCVFTKFFANKVFVVRLSKRFCWWICWFFQFFSLSYGTVYFLRKLFGESWPLVNPHVDASSRSRFNTLWTKGALNWKS